MAKIHIMIECGYVRHGLLRPLSKFGWCSDPVAKLMWNLLSSGHLNVKITGLKEIFTAKDLTNHGGFPGSPHHFIPGAITWVGAIYFAYPAIGDIQASAGGLRHQLGVDLVSGDLVLFQIYT